MPVKPICEIIIPVWNLWQRTKRCLDSIVQNTACPFRLILVDNASDRATAEFLTDFQRRTSLARLIRNEENLGNIKAVNQGIKISEADYVCILDNDTVVFPGWLEKMIEAAGSRQEIGIVNPASNSLGYRKSWYLSWEAYAKEIAEREKGRVVEMATAMGFCMLVKRSVIGRIGGWCEDYGMGYYEDRDYSRRAAEAGFICAQARDAFVYHEEHASFRILPKKKRDTTQNRALFERRFGVPERIAFVLSQPVKEKVEKTYQQALGLARKNHWVWVLLKGGRLNESFSEHSNLKWVPLPAPFFEWNCLFRILSKKKRFNRIYFDDPKLMSSVRGFQPLHGAVTEVLN